MTLHRVNTKSTQIGLGNWTCKWPQIKKAKTLIFQMISNEKKNYLNNIISRIKIRFQIIAIIRVFCCSNTGPQEAFLRKRSCKSKCANDSKESAKNSRYRQKPANLIRKLGNTDRTFQGLYYKILLTPNVRQMYIFRCEIVPRILSVINPLLCYKIHTL
jgi:hypothetical protein